MYSPVLAHKILKELNLLQNETFIHISYWGSVIYGTSSEKSDKDIVLIYEYDKEIYDVVQTKDYPNLFADELSNIDLHIISSATFQRLLNEHNIMALEVYYHTKDFLQDYFEFKLNLDTLRRKISAVVSNSWSKARKKLDIPEEDDYLGLKSLFHSIRILSFGIDIASSKTICFSSILIDYTMKDNIILGTERISCSNLLHRIKQKYESGWRWKEFKEYYTPIQNANASLFRILAPKELD